MRGSECFVSFCLRGGYVLDCGDIPLKKTQKRNNKKKKKKLTGLNAFSSHDTMTMLMAVVRSPTNSKGGTKIVWIVTRGAVRKRHVDTVY